MIRLLYISTTRQRHSPTELENILRVSRRNNLAADITGLLIAGGTRFLQVLEGPESSVDDTYTRICRDPRHFAPVILKKEPLEDRLFGAWAMGFQPGGSLNRASSVSDEVAALVAPIADLTLKAYFEGFVHQYAVA